MISFEDAMTDGLELGDNDQAATFLAGFCIEGISLLPPVMMASLSFSRFLTHIFARRVGSLIAIAISSKQGIFKLATSQMLKKSLLK